MVDEFLPSSWGDRRLRYLFLDLNSYFASVEQQERPELRGRPIAVVPVDADTSFVIAASYEAKRFGVRCGTMIRDAKTMCPGIEIVRARPPAYVHYHQKVIQAAQQVLPIDEVCSIDEMRFRLLGEERDPSNARKLAQTMKDTICREVGECMTCSVGVAPNAFLAKVATELEKPNGLVVLQAHELPHCLHGLKLTDFPGINRRTQIRLNAAGIFTTEQLCAASRSELALAFGSIIGDRWWYLLQGCDMRPETHPRKTLGHSHVLSPDRRNDAGCREVLLRLLQKASARLRATELWAGSMTVFVQGFKKTWDVRIKLPPTQDTVTMNEHFLAAWEKRDFQMPRSVGVTFHDLRSSQEVTPSLFDMTQERSQLNHAVDSMNQKFGKNTIFLAGMAHAKDTAGEKIAFNKTWLFNEGKGDNEWVDTFRGQPDYANLP